METETKNYILKIVNELQKNTKGCKDVVDVVGLARSLGFVVLKLKENSGIKGLIYVNDSSKDGPSTRLIAYDSTLDEKENRFIIAHELGHFYLHSNNSTFLKDGYFLYMYHSGDTSKSDDLEEEADFFAANLLLPEDEFIKQYNNYGDIKESQLAIDGLSDYFKVSRRCVRKRIGEVIR